MTSTANNQTPPAPNQPAIPSGPSYANAAGTSKKSGSTPLIATGSNPPPVVVGSSAPTNQHVKNSSVSPANGRPSIPPAVPTVVGAPPTVVHGSSLNGGSDHNRRSSVTIPNGPNSHFGNGGPVGGPKTNIRFGGFESPAVSHSTPQAPGTTPIPIPAGNPRITSPAHSPAPIPQPSASGGRPPSGLQQPTSQMIFGSPSGDGDRHMRQPSIPPANPSLAAQSHIRKESSQSMHSDMGNPGMPGPGPGRGGYQQGGRGRGGFNPHNQPFNGHMGFPPQNYRNGPGQGRGIPPAFQPGRGQIPPYGPNSPQPARASPALPPSIPGTPSMGAASMQPMGPGQLPAYHYAPPLHQQQGYGYPPAFDNFGRPLSMPPMPGYQMPFMQQPGAPAYQPQFVPAAYQPHGPGPQNMSRTPSQSERPNSSTGQPSQPVIVSGTVQGAGQKPASTNFARAKSSAITIKNEKGETISFNKMSNAPASPAPSIQQSRTPPAIVSTPTPPPKPSTPSHVRTDSQATGKTAKEIQEEMREKVALKAKEDKAKEDEAAAQAAQAAEAEAKAKAAAEAEETRKKADEEAKAARDAEAAAEAKRKEEEEAEKKRLEDEELERQIQEMEAEEARREEEERKYNEQKKIRDEAAKKKAEAERLANAAEEDRKLKEQEAEMERLEEEKERRRKEAESSGKTISFQDALAAAKAGATPTAETTPVVTVTDKMASLSITADSKPSTPTDATSQKTPTDKSRGPKPPALNLDRLSSKPVEPPPPSAALQSLRSARFLTVMAPEIYPQGINSPNPALNSAVTKKGKTFKYDANFLLQFQKVFTEQPSVEFHQQVKSLIGDTDGPRSAKPQSGSGRQNSRPGATPFSSMGSFTQAAPGGRTLPPGTTSADRFNMSSGNMPRPSVPPMGQFPGGRNTFPAPMARTPSSHNMAHAPGSPRVGSKRGSRRPNDAAKEAQAAKAMPLTANIEIEPIKISASGWKPTSIGNRSAQTQPGMGNLMDPEMVQRKVKAALNKMTPEKFDKIADQILEIAAQSKHEVDGRTLRQVIQLTFEKATDEAHWASMYAKFCKRMLETMSSEIRDESIKDKAGNVVSGGALFRKYLLNRCQEEFERGWKVNLPEPEAKDDKDKKSLEAAMLSDEYYIAAAAKRRGLGLVQFIGELYKLGMLTERIMHECVKKLLDYSGVPDEAEIESLSKLLRTIGASLDATEKGRPMMDAYFSRIHTMMELPELPSRLKFMLLDVMDLRKANWVSKETNKGPKTLEEVRAEAEAAAAQKAAEAARSNQRGGPGRPQMGRGDARQFSSQYSQPASNQVGMDDLRRLKGSASRTASQNVTLGPTSMFASRSNSGRRLGPGGSLSRAGDDSGPASRTGTPPTQSSHSNAFSLLANMETENPASPPSTAASPSLSKVVPDNSTGDDKKGE